MHILRSFVATVFLMLLGSLNGQTLGGGEIYYEQISQGKYKLTAHLYRSCSSGPLNDYKGYAIADKIEVPINFLRYAIQKINDTCGNPCNNLNDYGNPGFEKHSVTAVVDFNQAPYKVFVDSGKCMISFAIRQGGRDNSTTTMYAGYYYLESAVNICLNVSQNKSPTFSLDPRFFAACNQPLFYSPGALDSADFDSLGFSLEPVWVDYKQPITYRSNFNYMIPLTPSCPPNPGVINCRALPNAKPPRGFYFGQYGEMTLTPTNCNEKGYLRVKVSEFRRINNKMVLLGYVNREMLFEIKNQADNNPSIIATSINNGEYFICNTPIEIDLITIDEPFLPKQTAVDTTYIFYDGAYQNSSITIHDSLREKTAKITVYPNPKANDLWQHFTVAAYDKLCNRELNAKSFKVKNSKEVKFSDSISLDSCNHYRFQFKPIDSTDRLKSYVYITHNAVQTLVAYSQDGSGELVFNENGKHYIRFDLHYHDEKCKVSVYDTLDIKNAIKKAVFNLNRDSNVCVGFPAQIQFQPSKIPTLYSYEWFKNDSQLLVNDSFISMTIDKTTNIKLIAKDKNACRSVKEIRLGTFEKFFDLLENNYGNFCANDSFTLNVKTGKVLKEPIIYQIEKSGVTSTHQQSQIALKINGHEKLYLKATDDQHCSVMDSTELDATNGISFTVKANKNTICKDSSVQIQIENMSHAPVKMLSVINETDSSVLSQLIFNLSFQKKADLEIILLDSNDCASTEHLNLDLIPNPQIYSISSTPICVGDSTFVQLRFNGSEIDESIVWRLDGVALSTTDSVWKFMGNQSATASLRLSNRNQCIVEASHELSVFPLTRPVKILTDTFYHPMNRINLSADANYKTYFWFNGVQTKTNSFLASDLGAPGMYRIRLDVADANGCTSADSLHIYTDRRLNIYKTKSYNLQVYPNPASNILQVEVRQAEAFEIIAADGKLLLSGELKAGENSIAIAHLPAGVYVLRTASGSMHWIKN